MEIPVEESAGAAPAATQVKRGRRFRLWKVLLLTAAGLCLFGFAMMIYVSYRNTMTPAGIIIHHSAVSEAFDGREVDVSVIDSDHRRRGFRTYYWGDVYHVGYHYVILPDGTVQPGRPERCVGAHAVGHNDTLGICLVGDFSTAHNPDGARGLTAPNAAQMRSLVELCRRLREQYRLPPESVRRHSDVNDHTECPGDRFPFDELIRQVNGGAAAGQ